MRAKPRRRYTPQRPRRSSTGPIIFNVIILTALLIGILFFKHYASDKAADFIDEFGPGSGSGTGVAAERVDIAVGVSGNLVDQAADTALQGAQPTTRSSEGTGE